MSVKSLSIAFLSFIILNISHAQQVTNVRAEKDGDHVRITYDLSGEDVNDLYKIELYASHNNFITPLQMVTGDVGESINPGEDKLIIWRPMEELENFTGEIIFEIRATMMGTYYKVTQPTSSSKFNKGKTVSINWQGGNPEENVNLTLVRFDDQVEVLAQNIKNNGSYRWAIPKSLKGGKGYQVRVTNTQDNTRQGVSKAFKISGGLSPFILIGAPVVAGAAIAAVILSGGEPDDTGNGNGDGGDSDLPEPPGLPGN